jgi:hypothetical protein
MDQRLEQTLYDVNIPRPIEKEVENMRNAGRPPVKMN